MNGKLRILIAMTMTLWLIGCAKMIVVNDVTGDGAVNRPLTKEQVKQAILDAAKDARWTTKVAPDGTIIASFRERSHRVIVDITYTDDSYDIRYNSSFGMKVYCTQADRDAGRQPMVTGGKPCPGQAQPYYIHHAYGIWVGQLKHAIDFSLSYAG